MISCFENCFNLLKAVANMNWMFDHFPKKKVSHCLFRLLPSLAHHQFSMAIQEKEGDRVLQVGVIIQAENVLLPSVMLQAYSLLQV